VPRTLAPLLLARFDGYRAWTNLPVEEKEAIGPALLEFLCAQRALDASDGGPGERAAIAALDLLDGELMALLEPVMPPGFFYGAPAPLPSRLGRVCRVCGCSERYACVEADGMGCSWAEPDLCTVCAPAARSDEIRQISTKSAAGEVGDGGVLKASPHSGGADSTRPLQPLWPAT
jgi:hypothetical protein